MLIKGPGGWGEGHSREFWIGVCREGSWTLRKKAKTDTLFKAQTQKMTPYSRKKKVINSMKKNTLFLFCNIGCINDSHINDVGFSRSSIR